jgi:ATP-dependent DNA helicase RecQ
MTAASSGVTQSSAGIDAAVRLLREVFGYESFRLLQSDIIESVLAGNDALVVMPTGGGKSVCYQIPALLLPGLTVVVSPLISLMKDQVDQLCQLGVPAVMLNSSLAAPDYQRTVREVAAGQVRLLYCAPETLMKPDVLSLLERRGVSCLAIDEAHCISEWGHDFRPEYRMLAEVRRRFAQAVCIALTATATTRVRQDICRSLAMKESQVFVAGFNRPNLFYRVVPRANPEQQLAGFLDTHRGESGIIYAFSRDGVETLARTLRSRGHSVLPYHAGLDDQTRRRNQELFQNDDVRIIVATVAFGMGIHKTNCAFCGAS